MSILTKKKLQNALFVLGMMELNEIKKLPNVPIPCKEEYIAEQEKILTQACKEAYAPKLTPRRAIAAVLVAIFLLAVTACAAIEPIREFFVDVFDGFIKVEIEDPEDPGADEEIYPETIETAYAITNIPGGFMIIDDTRSPESTMTLWMNEEASVIIFQQNPIEGNNIKLDGDNAEYGEIVIEGRTVLKHYSDGMYVIMWKEHGYLFSISCSDTIPWETVVDMITGLAPEE